MCMYKYYVIITPTHNGLTHEQILIFKWVILESIPVCTEGYIA